MKVLTLLKIGLEAVKRVNEIDKTAGKAIKLFETKIDNLKANQDETKRNNT